MKMEKMADKIRAVAVWRWYNTLTRVVVCKRQVLYLVQDKD